MISVDQALDLVEQNVSTAHIKDVPLLEALGLIVAKDIVSPIDMPPFAQSAMDGYAIHFSPEIINYQIIGEVQAGSEIEYQLGRGEAVRIFTGAAVPDSATSVIRQEDATVNGKTVTFEPVKDSQNIRPKGEQIKAGELALSVETEVTPGIIGFLASIGIKKVPVFPRPHISILTTGNELVKVGNELKHGQVYESNSVMLEACLHYYGFRDIEHIYVKDTFEATQTAIQKALGHSDLIILSGGVSVGDYDFVSKALHEQGVKEIFHKVRQKPGKPLFFGTKDTKLIFGLPGNPAAAITSFYLYILPSLNKLTGGSFEGCKQIELPLKEYYKRKANRTEFLKAFATDEEVSILGAQSSAMLSSFTDANALVVIPEDVDEVDAGDFVVVLLL